MNRELYESALYQLEYENIYDKPLPPKDDPFLLPLPSYDLYHCMVKALTKARSISMSREECFKKLVEEWIGGRLPRTDKPKHRYIRPEELDHTFCRGPYLENFPNDDLQATYNCMEEVTADRDEAPTKLAELFNRGAQMYAQRMAELTSPKNAGWILRFHL